MAFLCSFPLFYNTLQEVRPHGTGLLFLSQSPSHHFLFPFSQPACLFPLFPPFSSVSCFALDMRTARTARSASQRTLSAGAQCTRHAAQQLSAQSHAHAHTRTWHSYFLLSRCFLSASLPTNSPLFIHDFSHHLLPPMPPPDHYDFYQLIPSSLSPTVPFLFPLALPFALDNCGLEPHGLMISCILLCSTGVHSIAYKNKQKKLSSYNHLPRSLNTEYTVASWL